MENQNKNTFVEKVGHAIGCAMATTVVACFVAILVTLTIKLIMFIL
jgi:hypothetical protein